MEIQPDRIQIVVKEVFDEQTKTAGTIPKVRLTVSKFSPLGELVELFQATVNRPKNSELVAGDEVTAEPIVGKDRFGNLCVENDGRAIRVRKIIKRAKP